MFEEFDRAEPAESVTLEHKPLGVYRQFNDIVSSAPYLDGWVELQDLDGNELLYALQFPESLEVTDQVYSSVAEYIAGREVEMTILEQREGEIIVRVPALGEEAIEYWYYDEHGEYLN